MSFTNMRRPRPHARENTATFPGPFPPTATRPHTVTCTVQRGRPDAEGVTVAEQDKEADLQPTVWPPFCPRSRHW